MVTSITTKKATKQKTPTDQATTQKKGPNAGKIKCRLHSHPIHPRTRRELQEDLWEMWYPNTFQGEQDIKTAAGQTQRSGPQGKKRRVIYSYQCGEVTYNKEYIGETGRTLGERYREHLKEPSPIHAHSQQTGHIATPDNFSIIGREDKGLTMNIKESVYIRVNNPTLNRNIGKYNLNHLWDRVLLNTPGLKINSPNGYAHTQNSEHAHSIPTSEHLQINIGHSGHTLNSEHALRSS